MPNGVQADRPPSSRETFEQAIEMLREDRSRGFNIDIETDTMVFEDQKAEKAARVEFIGSVSNFLKEAVPAAQLYPQIAPILIELLMFGVRGFKAGQHLEQVFEEATDQLAEAGPQQQKLDPKIEEAKGRAEADKARLAVEAEKAKATAMLEAEKLKAATAEAQARMQMEARRMEMDHQFRMAQLGQKTQLDGARLSHDTQATERDDQRDDALAQAEIEGSAADRELEAERIGLERQGTMADAMLRADQTSQRREQATQMARSKSNRPQA